MFLWFLKQLPIETTAGTVALAGALQLTDIDLVGMGSDLPLDLLGVSGWLGDWFELLL